MDGVHPLTTDVVICGAGPAGAATAIWLARAGVEVIVADRATFPRDKTCGDGLTPRAVSELRRLGLDAWATQRIAIRGLRLRGFGAEQDIPWPPSRFGTVGAAVPRREFDHALLRAAATAGATVVEGVTVRLSAPAHPRTAARPPAATTHPLELRHPDGSTQQVHARFVVGADGARSSLGRALGRRWHRDIVYATAARCYIRSGRHAEPWIGSDLELRDASGAIQPGYGWVFPLGNGEVNLGVGALSTADRPAGINVKELLQHYAAQVGEEWQLDGSPRAVSSALLPMGGAVSGIAGPDWALTGDAAALINPLNGEGIDYALEAGRHLARLIRAHLRHPAPDGAGLSELWPRLLRSEFGASFALARRLAALLTYPRVLARIGPIGMASSRLLTATVRCMGNTTTAEDADWVSLLWRSGGALTQLTERPLGRPLFG